MKATTSSAPQNEHPPLARDTQGNLLALPEGTCAWRICRHTKGRPRIINGPDKQPARFPLDLTAEDLADACGADTVPRYALDDVGNVIDYVTTIETARELRNAGDLDAPLVPVHRSTSGGSDLRYALEAVTHIARVFQTRNKQTTTPKGRTRRTIPMTSTLHEALKRMSVIRDGLVVRNLDGSAKTDDQADKAMGRICRRAGLPVFLFHRLRHTFGTHAALFGVNPWRLQAWLGHKRIDETMLYVHVAEAHPRELPEHVQQAACSETDPDRRILSMLGARGKTVAKTQATETQIKRSA